MNDVAAEVERAPDADAGERFTGLHRESVDGADFLEREAEARTLALQLTSRGLKPPFTLGLFGEWGSGKSFFMRLLQREVEHLAGSHPRLVRRAVPVNVNAWEESQANAWSSILFKVLDALQAARGETVGDVLFEELETGRELRQAEAATTARLKQETKQLNDELASLDRRLGDLAREHTVTEAGIDETKRRHAAHIRHIEARETSMWSAYLRAFASLNGWWVAGFAAIVAILGATYVLNGMMLNGNAGEPSFLGKAVVANYEAVRQYCALALVSALYAKGFFAFRSVRAGRRAIADLEKMRAHDAMVQDSQTSLQRDRTRLAAEFERAMAALKQSDGRSTAQTSAAESLADFIAARLTEADNKAYLGLLGQLRRDFRTISEAVTSGELGDIARLIVYIDDLDRCPASRVTEVLEACHLLLGFEGFVVVVAADPRWIGRSLQAHYAPQLGARPDLGAAIDFRQANALPTVSPLDYLEKIIQLPFWLPPLDERRCVNLIEGLLNAAVRDRRLPDIARPDADEVAFIGELAFLLRSPRTAKRFLNVYHILRDRQTAAASGGPRAIATALALVHGEPKLAVALIHSIMGTSGELAGWLNGLDSDLEIGSRDASPLWDAHRSKLKALIERAIAPAVTVEQFRHDLQTAQRFSFLNL